MTGSNPWSDANALASPVRELFRVDVTTAVGRWSTCAHSGPMAQARVFDHAPGVVAQRLADAARGATPCGWPYGAADG